MTPRNTSDSRLILLSDAEYALRLSRLQEAMDADGMLISAHADLYWLTGRVFAGFAYVPRRGAALYGLRRCVHLTGDTVEPARKIEDFAARIAALLPAAECVALETGVCSYDAVERYRAAFAAQWPEVRFASATGALRSVRAVKTDEQLRMMRLSGVRHSAVYRRIPQLYREGMSDYELQVAIERVSRLEGCLGQFRIAGSDMELFMGNVLAGDNADSPSPYDFAMGGRGMDPSLPVGADGTVIRPGTTVMVDMNGDYTGYMPDMTRTFFVGSLPDEAVRAHERSRAICRRLAEAGTPGAAACDMYATALEMAREAGLEHCFMGHRQHAGFVGHGLGIEINEAPVIAPRSRDVLRAGMCIALEPKFVIAGVGAVGIENTYVVRPDGSPMECLTDAPEQLINLAE